MLNADKSPKEIDIAESQDSKMLGIYSMENETLRICFKVTGKVRPSEFGSKKDSKIAFVVLKRLSKDSSAMPRQ